MQSKSAFERFGLEEPMTSKDTTLTTDTITESSREGSRTADLCAAL